MTLLLVVITTSFSGLEKSYLDFAVLLKVPGFVNRFLLLDVESQYLIICSRFVNRN